MASAPVYSYVSEPQAVFPRGVTVSAAYHFTSWANWEMISRCGRLLPPAQLDEAVPRGEQDGFAWTAGTVLEGRGQSDQYDDFVAFHFWADNGYVSHRRWGNAQVRRRHGDTIVSVSAAEEPWVQVAVGIDRLRANGCQLVTLTGPPAQTQPRGWTDHPDGPRIWGEHQNAELLVRPFVPVDLLETWRVFTPYRIDERPVMFAGQWTDFTEEPPRLRD